MDWLRLESPAYWTTLVVCFFAVSLWESARPERAWTIPTGRRWSVHGILLLLGTAMAILLVRLTPVAAAMRVAPTAGSWRSSWAWGLVAFLALDFTRYVVHGLFHRVPWLWRFHRVHHADPDFDLSTAFRFHPVEAVAMRGAYIGVVLLMAPPAAAVLLAELTSCVANFFDHANAELPGAWDRRLRRWIVTPSVHRLHHSAELGRGGANLAELFPWWDKLLGTYREPMAGDTYAVGLQGYQNEASMDLGGMLAEPFKRERV